MGGEVGSTHVAHTLAIPTSSLAPAPKEPVSSWGDRKTQGKPQALQSSRTVAGPALSGLGHHPGHVAVALDPSLGMQTPRGSRTHGVVAPPPGHMVAPADRLLPPASLEASRAWWTAGSAAG